MGRFAFPAVVLAQAPSAAVLCTSALADNAVRIADQCGLAYRPLRVAVEHKLIERHAAAAVPDARVEILQLGSGTATGDALISGNVDIAMAAGAVRIDLRGESPGRNTVKGMMAIADRLLPMAKAEHRKPRRSTSVGTVRGRDPKAHPGALNLQPSSAATRRVAARLKG